MATTRQRLVGIAGGSVGNLVEYYDWYVYSSFSLYFAHVFFPKGDQTAQLLSTASLVVYARMPDTRDRSRIEA